MAAACGKRILGRKPCAGFGHPFGTMRQVLTLIAAAALCGCAAVAAVVARMEP